MSIYHNILFFGDRKIIIIERRFTLVLSLSILCFLDSLWVYLFSVINSWLQIAGLNILFSYFNARIWKEIECVKGVAHFIYFPQFFCRFFCPKHLSIYSDAYLLSFCESSWSNEVGAANHPLITSTPLYPQMCAVRLIVFHLIAIVFVKILPKPKKRCETVFGCWQCFPPPLFFFNLLELKAGMRYKSRNLRIKYMTVQVT